MDDVGGAFAVAIVSAIGVWLGSLLFTTPDRSNNAPVTPLPSTCDGGRVLGHHEIGP